MNQQSQTGKRRIGFIAGCFDPFPHPGQIWAMQQAVDAGACDSIVVALHTDPSKERPQKSRVYLSVEERKMLLEALKWTDRVIPYDTEADLIRILRETKPDVRILGDDYQGKPYTGHELNYPIFWAQRRPEWSATNFRARIREGDYAEETAQGKTG